MTVDPKDVAEALESADNCLLTDEKDCGTGAIILAQALREKEAEAGELRQAIARYKAFPGTQMLIEMMNSGKFEPSHIDSYRDALLELDAAFSSSHPTKKAAAVEDGE